MAVSDEDDLALAVHRHEQGAFDRLVERFECPLFRYVQRLLMNDHDAQEVVQDAFVRAHRALTAQYGDDKVRTLQLRPWLFRIARNLSYNRRRGKGAKLEQPLDSAREDQFQPHNRPVLITTELEDREEKAQLDRAIALLPTENRDLILLRFVEEMSYAEISRTTGFNEASLRGKVFRSLKLLRDALGVKGVSHAM